MSHISSVWLRPLVRSKCQEIDQSPSALVPPASSPSVLHQVVSISRYLGLAPPPFSFPCFTKVTSTSSSSQTLMWQLKSSEGKSQFVFLDSTKTDCVVPAPFFLNYSSFFLSYVYFLDATK